MDSETSLLTEEALKEHLASQRQAGWQELPALSGKDGWIARGYADETGEPTPLAEDYLMLEDLGLFDQAGQLTPKGRAFALDPQEALMESNLDAYIERDQAGLNETPDQSFGEALGGVGGFLKDAVKGTFRLLKGNPATNPLGYLLGDAEREAETVLTAQSVAEGAFEGPISVLSGARGIIEKGIAKLTDDERAYFAAKQKHARTLEDMKSLEAGDIYGGLADSQRAVETMNSARAQARQTLGEQRADVIEQQGEAGGSLFFDPSNIATFGVGGVVGTGAKLPAIARMSAKAEQAAMAAVRAEQAALALSRAKLVADKSARGAQVAARGVEDAMTASKGIRAKNFQQVAERLGKNAEEIAASLPVLEQQALDAAAHAKRLAESSGNATKFMEGLQRTQEIGRQVRAAPAKVLGPMVESIGSGVMKADGWVKAAIEKIGPTRALLGGVGLGGAEILAIPAALAAGPAIRSVGRFTKVLGDELMQARGTVPFWRRVAQNSATTPIGRATAHAFDFATLGGKLPTLAGNTAKGIAAAAPVDMAFEVVASGGDMSPGTLRQGLAESLVFGGGGALGGAMMKGRVNDLRARAAGDELNFRKTLSPEALGSFNQLGKGERKNISIYAATFPGLKFDFTENGSSNYDRSTNTATINTSRKDWLRPIIAHEVNHHIAITGQMEDGVVSMLVGEQGGLLRSKDGTLDPNFRAFMDTYNQRAKAAGVPQVDVNQAAAEYFTEAVVDSLLEATDNGKLQRKAARSAGERMMRRFVESTVSKNTILKELFFRTGGALDGKGRVVPGNGLLADGVRELPEAKAMLRKAIDELAGVKRQSAPLAAPKPETIEVKPEDKGTVDSMFSIFETDAEGNVLREKDGSPKIITKETDKARATVGKAAIAEIERQADAETAILSGETPPTLDPLDDSDPTVREEIESETPEQKAQRVKRKEDDSYEGTHLSPRAIQAIRKKGVLNKLQIEILRMLNRASRDLQGDTYGAIYHPAIERDQFGKNLRYAPIEASLREFVPTGIKIAKNGNINVILLELNQLASNISNRAKTDAGKRLYGGNELAIREDVEAVLNLHRKDVKPDAYFEGKYGTKWKQHKEFINSVLSTDTKVQREANPLFAEVGNAKSVFKSFRIDRISKTVRNRGGKPMPLGPNNYEHAKVNYFPDGLPQ